MDDPILRAAEVQAARDHLIPFARQVYPRFECPPHISYIARLLEDCEARRIRCLAVSVPVRHGKSTLCSQVFPAWYVGRNPRDSVILASYAFVRRVRDIGGSIWCDVGLPVWHYDEEKGHAFPPGHFAPCVIGRDGLPRRAPGDESAWRVRGLLAAPTPRSYGECVNSRMRRG